MDAHPITVRDATEDDWPAIWPFMRAIIAAGETYAYDRDMSEDQARAIWFAPAPARTLVAADGEGHVLGTAIMGPNRGGGGAHVATASFMVDPDAAGRGAGRALGEAVIARSREEGYRAIQFNAVVETNAPAVHLWRSLGFAVIGTVPEAFAHPSGGYVGLHVMHRPL